CPAHLPQWPGWRASGRLQHDEWQASGWDQRELSFGFHEQASVHNYAANSCGVSASVSGCAARTSCLRSLGFKPLLESDRHSYQGRIVRGRAAPTLIEKFLYYEALRVR